MTCLSGHAILAPTPKGMPTPIIPNGPEFRRWPGANVGIDWRPKFRISWPSTQRIASRFMKFFTSSHRRSGWIGVLFIDMPPPVSFFFAASPSASFLRHCAKFSGFDAPRQSRRSAAAAPPCSRRRSPISILRGAVAISSRVDVDPRDLGVGAEARRRGVADDVVHARAEDDDEIGVLERRGAHGEERERMIVGHARRGPAASCRTGCPPSPRRSASRSTPATRSRRCR